jgi:8-oxo-dGTP pyrophosphatase MutT (NUDIX family)
MGGRCLVVKAIIVKYFKFLVLIRRKDGLPDLPGGHLEKGEDVFQGLVREVSEETGLVVGWTVPVKRWILQAGKCELNGITFCCEYKKGRVILSREHTHYFWLGLKYIKYFTPRIWVPEFWGMEKDIMLFDPVYLQDRFEDDRSDIEIASNSQCPVCGIDQEETFPKHYIFKDFPENYLERKISAESDIMSSPRIP